MGNRQGSLWEFEFIARQRKRRGEQGRDRTDNRRARINSGRDTRSQTGWLPLPLPLPRRHPPSRVSPEILSAQMLGWRVHPSPAARRTPSSQGGRTRILGCSRGDKLRPPRPCPVGVVSKSQGPALKQHHTVNTSAKRHREKESGR